MTALDDFLAAEYPVPDDDEERARFVVDGPGKAEWALGKLAAVQRQMTANETLAEHKREQVAEWLADANRPLQRDVEFFTGLLTAWWRDELAKALADAGGDWQKVKRKTASLPSGKVGGTYRQPVPEYVDEDAAATFLAIDHPELVVTVTRAKKAEVKQAIASGVLAVANGALVDVETGEPVPGVSVPEVADVLDALAITVKASE